jgi:hypothetical protein
MNQKLKRENSRQAARDAGLFVPGVYRQSFVINPDDSALRSMTVQRYEEIRRR